MLRPRFFTTQPLAPGHALSLEPDPSRHVARALRMQSGDALCLFDGSGREAHGVITVIERNAVQVRVADVMPVDRESSLRTTLAISVSRGDRMDTVVQKATELGVDEIRPLVSERTEVKLDPARLAKKREHWQRVAISACEQCGRNRIPTIHSTARFPEVLEVTKDSDALKLVLHPGAATEPLPEQCLSLVFLIGPEGGFNDREVSAAQATGFRPLVLGPRILRTETAPLAAMAFAQARWGDLLG